MHSGDKLTAEQAARIFADPRRGADIACEYGVSRQAISQIKRGHAWQHVTRAPVQPVISRDERAARRAAAKEDRARRAIDQRRQASIARWSKPGAREEHGRRMAARFESPEIRAAARAWWTPDRRTQRANLMRELHEQRKTGR